MYYSNEDGSVGVWIYNSRDGVTPFICFKDGIELQHRYWNKDLQQPNYKPKAGDLVWRDIIRSEVEDVMRHRIEKHPEYLFGRDIEEMVRSAGDDAENNGSPCLAVVDEAGQFIKYESK